MEKHSFSTLNNICALATNDMDNLGTFFNSADAAARIANYFKATGLNPKDPKLVFGQLLGVSMLQQLLDKISAFNDDSGPDNQLLGVRIYNAMSIRPNLPAPDNGTMLPDVVLVPVYANGNDIFDVLDFDDPKMTLSGGMPCPNECGTAVYLQ